MPLALGLLSTNVLIRIGEHPVALSVAGAILAAWR